MTTLFPPEYPACPEAPLRSFGPSFSEETARSLSRALCRAPHEDALASDAGSAAGLTMLEGFHANYILYKAR